MTSPSSTSTLVATEVKGTSPVPDRLEALIGRVRAEYREMPGLCLTVQQACRLWQIDVTNCTRILEGLLAERFLRRTATGAFIAEVSGPLNLALKGEKR